MYKESEENILLFGAHFLKQREYWNNKLSGHQGKTAFFSPVPSSPSHWGKREEVEMIFPGPVYRGLLKLSKGINLSLYVVLLTALKALLYRYTARESAHKDIIVISPVYIPKVTEETINRYIYIKDLLEGKDTFKQAALKVRQSLLEGYGNQDYPAEKLLEFLSGSPLTESSPVSRSVAAPDPFSDVVCILDNIHDSDLAHLESGKVLFLFSRQDEQLAGHISYETGTFEANFFNQVARHFVRVLENFLEDSELTFSGIPLLSEEEKKQILYEFNHEPGTEWEDKSFTCLFEEQVEKTPDHMAIIGRECGQETAGRVIQLTYRALNQRANRLAAFLEEKGALQDQQVGILMDRSPAMVESILAIWKARAIYVPLDGNNPTERILYMLENSRAKLLLSETPMVKKHAFSAALPGKETSRQEFAPEIVLVDEIVGDLASSLTANPGLPRHSAELAYIIYTSGSTGMPKGAMVEHAGMINHMAAKIKDLHISPASVISQNSPHTFDISIWQFFAALICGGRTIIYPDSLVLDPAELIRRLVQDNVTLLEVVPSYLSALLEHLNVSPALLNTLAALLVTGETIPPALVKRWFDMYPNTQMVNVYGPTEASDDITHYFMRQAPQRESIPIGKPIANLRIYILDADGNLCPVGVPGEIVVSGIGVGRGYIGDREKTREVFTEDPFLKKKGVRTYRTGDLGAWLPDGNIDFYGRKDHQVKIRGYRIELGEIETCLLGIPGVSEAATVIRHDEDRQLNDCLCAYITTAAGINPDIKEIKNYLKERLPGYMVPEYIYRLETMPLTKNGKIHREALPSPDAMRQQDTYLAPRNPLEEKMAGTWKEVLGVEKVGIEDNFFELGGDSIKAIQLSARMQKHGFNIKIGDLFLYPTIRELVKIASPGEQKVPVPQEPIVGEVEMLPIQQAFFESKITHPHHYNQAVMIYSEQGFAEEIIRQVFTRLVEHHDMLRAVFRQDPASGRVRQETRNLDEPLFDLVVQYIDQNTPSEIEKTANKLQQSIDLENGPLVKVGLFKTTNGDYLLLVIHHLVIEGVSWRILFDDFNIAYRQVQNAEPVQLPAKTDSFKRWVDSLKEYAQDRVFKHLEYWKNVTQTHTEPLHRDYSLEPQQQKNKYREQIKFRLEETLTTMLVMQTGQAYGTEVNELLITALGLAIKKWSGMTKIPVTLEGHGREDIVTSIVITHTVGWFSSEFPVILDLDGIDAVPDAVKTIKEILRRIPNKGIDYGILKYLSPKEKITQLNLDLKPQICFNYIG
ncbi:MAG: amino acid adenylation domain-containing protein, partial [Acidobacteria bacterium]|nr:amino acid adenylation domain-containing protein [Acidobacteriota bacterium]